MVGIPAFLIGARPIFRCELLVSGRVGVLRIHESPGIFHNFIHYKLPMRFLSLARDDRSGKNPVLHGFFVCGFFGKKALLVCFFSYLKTTQKKMSGREATTTGRGGETTTNGSWVTPLVAPASFAHTNY